MQNETQLKLRHAAAARAKDEKEMLAARKELAKIGIEAEWLSEDVLIWRGPEKKRKRGRPKKTDKPS